VYLGKIGCKRGSHAPQVNGGEKKIEESEAFKGTSGGRGGGLKLQK